MTRDELIRRLARRRGVAFDVSREQGKGSHWVLIWDGRKQPVPQAGGGDIKPGTLATILRELGLKRRDLE